MKPSLDKWIQYGACFDTDPESFYSRELAPATAEKYCYTCPVREECLDYGVTNGIDGLWGGHWINTTKKATPLFTEQETP